MVANRRQLNRNFVMADDPKNNVNPDDYDDDNPDLDNIKRLSDDPVWGVKAPPPDPDDDVSTPENISYLHKRPAFQAGDDDERDPNTPRLEDHPNYKQSISVAPITALKDKLRAAPSPGDIIKIMSDHHATITIDTKFWIIQDLGLGAPIGLISEETLVKQFKNCKFGIKDSNEKPVNVAIMWLNSPNVRECSEYIFDPQHEYNPISPIFNKWRGFGTKEILGPYNAQIAMDCCSIISYYWNDICSGDANKFQFMMGWCAHMFQKPEEKPGVAFALTGPKGIGKSLFFWILKRLLDGKTRAGRAQKYYHKVSKGKGLLPRFNSHLEENILLVSEEVSLLGDKELRGAINDFITSDIVSIEIKNGPIRDVNSYSRMGITINDDHFVSATSDERRYGIFKVSAAHQGNKGYFKNIITELNGCAEALMHLFMHWDISDFDPRKYPETVELGDQKVGSFTGVDRWWYNKLQDGRLPLFEDAAPGMPCRVITEKLSHDYIRSEKDAWLRTIFSKDSFGRRLHKLCSGIDKSGKIKNESSYNLGGKAKWINVYTIPPLRECRKMFEETQKTNIDWNQDTADWDADLIWIVDGII
jgi:hypothetical protein